MFPYAYADKELRRLRHTRPDQDLVLMTSIRLPTSLGRHVSAAFDNPTAKKMKRAFHALGCPHLAHELVVAKVRHTRETPTQRSYRRSNISLRAPNTTHL